jgi:hypothetical protein
VEIGGENLRQGHKVFMRAMGNVSRETSGVFSGDSKGFQPIPRVFRQFRRHRRRKPPPPAPHRRANRQLRGKVAGGGNDISGDIGGACPAAASFLSADQPFTGFGSGSL